MAFYHWSFILDYYSPYVGSMSCGPTRNMYHSSYTSNILQSDILAVIEGYNIGVRATGYG